MLESRHSYEWREPNNGIALKDITDVANYFCTSVQNLPKAICNQTECEAWISWDVDSVSIGSIVEGSDAEFMMRFVFPVASGTIEDWLEELKQLTDEAWCEANGDYDNCDNEVGYDPYLGCYTDDV